MFDFLRSVAIYTDKNSPLWGSRTGRLNIKCPTYIQRESVTSVHRKFCEYTSRDASISSSAVTCTFYYLCFKGAPWLLMLSHWEIVSTCLPFWPGSPHFLSSFNTTKFPKINRTLIQQSRKFFLLKTNKFDRFFSRSSINRHFFHFEFHILYSREKSFAFFFNFDF